jgi:photosystem II stability/assembly factor-like uncharacterized protein
MKAILLLAGATVLSAGVDRWTPLGPDGGGAGLLAVDPLNPGTLYASTNGGLFKTRDGASTWIPTGFGVRAGCLAVDPRVSGVLYACSPFGGLFKSTDGGSSWREVDSGIGTCAHVSALAIDPQDSSTVYAACFFCGLFKSVDAGTSWRLVNPLIILNLAIDPSASRALYAATGQGPFKSVDGGATWTKAIAGMGPNSGGLTMSIAVDPRRPSILFFSNSTGLFRSTDGAKTWSAEAFPAKGAPVIVVFDPQDSNVLYAGSSSGIFKSMDGGATWTASGLPATDIRSLAVDPFAPGTVYAGGDDLTAPGVFKTTDNAANWNRAESGLRAVTISALMFDSQKPPAIYANTNSPLIISSIDGGQNWDELIPGSLLATDPLNSSTTYANLGGKLYKSTDWGGYWQLANKGLSDQNQCGTLGPVIIDPRNTNILYAGLRQQGGKPGCQPVGSVLRSIDAGASWSKLDSQPEGEGVVGLAIDPQDSALLYAWNGKGLFQSTDNGGSWAHLLSGNYVGALAIDPQNPSALYAAQGIYGFYTETAKVFQSSDRGKTWSEADSGIPMMTLYGDIPSSMLAIHALAVDPHTSGTVYAGTLAGVFRTRDDGANWISVNAGLTNPNVHALAFDPNDSKTLYAGTDSGVFVITFGQ